MRDPLAVTECTVLLGAIAAAAADSQATLRPYKWFDHYIH